MLELTVRDHIDAAHHLRGHPGKCRNLHGHRFEIAVTLQVDAVDSLGMGCDFGRMKEILRKQVIDVLDHRLLNDLPPFDRVNPTAESLARFAFERCRGKFPAGQRLVRCQVWESPDAWVVYSEDSGPVTDPGRGRAPRRSPRRSLRPGGHRRAPARG